MNADSYANTLIHIFHVRYSSILNGVRNYTHAQYCTQVRNQTFVKGFDRGAVGTEGRGAVGAEGWSVGGDTPPQSKILDFFT